MANEKNVYKEVWDVLSKVDVSEHTDDKGGLTYLSWAWAWGTLMKHYPEAEYEIHEAKFFPDNSCEVGCTVTIKGESRYMWLPVMDFRNNAIMNPDARKISDTKMRCLTKCISMWGLGHYIYAGEDLHEDGPPKKSKPKATKVVKDVAKDAVEIAKEALDAKVIPDLGLVKEAKTIESLRDLFTKNKEEYEALGDKVFAVIRKEFNDRKHELKKGATNGTA